MLSIPCVKTAVLLAAGTGSRLSPLTDVTHKCLTEVHGTPILKQQVSCLERWGFETLIVVVGHCAQDIREYLDHCETNLKIRYVFNPKYRTTNNLYSLWLARKVIMQPFLLLECDLFFDTFLLAPMRYPDRVAIATQHPWMNGTTVTLDDSQRVKMFHLAGSGGDVVKAWKTVNIYSLSLATWERMKVGLDSYVASGRVNEYYEVVFRDMSAGGCFNPKSVSFDDGNWYEIDTLADLALAERLFVLPTPPADQLRDGILPLDVSHQSHHG